jgi:hypothetical protein
MLGQRGRALLCRVGCNLWQTATNLLVFLVVAIECLGSYVVLYQSVKV